MIFAPSIEQKSRPVLGDRSPHSIFASVDLPDPFFPVIAIDCCCISENEILSKITRRLKAFESDSTEREMFFIA